MNQRNAVEKLQLLGLPDHCRLNLQAIYGNLKNAELKAANYLIENTGQIMTMSIGDFARNANCSEATVVRLSRRLGYEGYPELKADIADDEGRDKLVGYTNISSEDDPFQVVEKVIDSTVAAVKDTLAVIDRDAYMATCNAMVTAGTVMYCGVGDGGIVAREAYQKSLRAGQAALFSEDPDIQLIMASQLCEKDLLIAVSHSGMSTSVINTVKTAKKTGTITAAITNFPVSPLTKQVDHVLQTAVFSKVLNSEVISKRIAELCVIESLYINYLLMKGKSTMDILSRSNNVVEINKS